MTRSNKQFVQELTDWQGRLLGYLMTLLGDINDARDVLQETNIVLWSQMEQFDTIVDFGAWSRKCAYFQALAFLRDRKRDRHIFDDELLAVFADENVGWAHDDDERRLALRHCLAQLTDRQRRLIDQRYREDISVRELADNCGMKQSAMKMTLMRIREALRVCIEGKTKQPT